MSEAERGPARRVVDGRFELEARLGGGGMGTVWRARDLVLHRFVAVKEVRPPDRDLAEYDPDSARMLRERVLREARALARIDHPNVVTIHHIVDGGEGTYPWLVMELVAGGSLADRLARGPMHPAEAARIGRGVLAALTAAHDAGIQHRDVKPANVLLRPDGRPVLTDFGIAAIRETTNLTATGSIIGTADFMAPERITGHEGGAASDLWSLAMMLYTAVEGHHPLRRGTTLATLAAVLHEDVPPPTQAGPLGAVLMDVLVRDPAARPPAAVLDRRLAGIEADPTGHASLRDEPTSYRLTPPSAPMTPPPPPTQRTQGIADSAPTFLPYGGAPAGAPTAPATAPRRRGSVRPVLLGLSGISFAGALAVMWWVLPLGGNDSAGAGGSTPSTTGSPAATPASQRSQDSATRSATTDLLTPDNIRTAVKAIETETGRKRFGDLTVYSDYVSAEVMVKGSNVAYESYTYRPGQGVEKSIIDGTLSSLEKPFSPEIFNWDKVPSLMKEAAKKLNVKDPENRYIVVMSPDPFNPEFGLGVYRTDKYGRTGYLRTDTKGKIVDVYPAEK
ncbi:serine/threonine-protein kinase [Streptomyces sp. NPDC005648]|uniref:serine/threonine-protein kinase n=1 Tax=Streptomyces sp. NPDC005648 TaxID=3157044 RepID=UPI0033AB1E2D